MIDLGQNGLKLRSLCEYLSRKLTHKLIDEYLGFANVENTGKRVYPNGLDANKKDKLYNSLINDFNKKHKIDGIIRFLEVMYEPSKYTNDKESFVNALQEVNKYLIQMGLIINNSGKVNETKIATTLDEVDDRINKLKHEIQLRGLHKEVLNYCTRELLAKDYYHSIFEAAKGVFERIRIMSGETIDGFNLVEKVFNKDRPILMMRGNYFETDTDRNIYFGNVFLLKYLVKALRNPIAHVPRKDIKEEMSECLEILSTVSLAHKFLDECYKWF